MAVAPQRVYRVGSDGMALAARWQEGGMGAASFRGRRGRRWRWWMGGAWWGRQAAAPGTWEKGEEERAEWSGEAEGNLGFGLREL